MIVFQEKEKELEVRNIYAARNNSKPPHHLNSSFTSPSLGPEVKPSEPTLTAMERAKQMDQKRREDEKKKRLVSLSKFVFRLTPISQSK